MIAVSNIRAKDSAVNGWYEADLFDDESGDSCIGRWYFARPSQVELFSADGAMIGDINRARDPEAANVVDAFVAHHVENERVSEATDAAPDWRNVMKYQIGSRIHRRQLRLGGPVEGRFKEVEVRGILVDGKWWRDAWTGETEADLLEACAMMERNDKLADEQRALFATEEEYRRFLDEGDAG